MATRSPQGSPLRAGEYPPSQRDADPVADLACHGWHLLATSAARGIPLIGRTPIPDADLMAVYLRQSFWAPGRGPRRRDLAKPLKGSPSTCGAGALHILALQPNPRLTGRTDPSGHGTEQCDITRSEGGVTPRRRAARHPCRGVDGDSSQHDEWIVAAAWTKGDEAGWHRSAVASAKVVT